MTKLVELTREERVYLVDALRVVESYPSVRRKIEKQIGAFGSERLWSAKERLEESL